MQVRIKLSVGLGRSIEATLATTRRDYCAHDGKGSRHRFCCGRSGYAIPVVQNRILFDLTLQHQAPPCRQQIDNFDAQQQRSTLLLTSIA